MFVGKGNSRNNLKQMKGTCQFDKVLPIHLTGCHSDNANLVNQVIVSLVSLTNQNLSD